MPLRPRPPGARVREREERAPAISPADRNALSVLAENVRGRWSLGYVAVFRHEGATHTAFEEVARASTLEVEAMSTARVAGHAAVRGMRRFARRAVLLDGGVYVAAAEVGRHEVVSVVAAGADDAPLPEAAGAALVELVQMAARVLSEPAETPAAEPPDERSSDRAAGPASTYGTRFGDALAFLQRPPIHAETRERLARAVDQRHTALGSVIWIVETDLGLTLALLEAANRLPDLPRGGIASVPAAIAELGPRGVVRLTEELPPLEPFASGDRMATALARVSAHAISTHAAADLLARLIGDNRRDELRLAAVVHDIGKLTLAAVSDGYMRGLSEASLTPEQRLRAERERFGIDHAAVGALTLRRLGLPRSVAMIAERHHSDDLSGPAAIIRLADMVAHVASGDAVAPATLAALGRSLSVDEAQLQAITYDLTRAGRARDAVGGPSPLTTMQEKALRGIADGKTYKQIAADLNLSESTVRSHLHNLYRTLGVTDRAQAVLLATGRGWI